MTKTQFLKEAKAKYKEAVNKKWVAEMNFVYSPSLILRVWFDHVPNPPLGSYMHRWCKVDIMESHDKERKIIRRAGEILSGDTDEDIQVMIDILRKELTTNPEETADYVEGITMWENVELDFTVKSACEYIGIE